MAFFVIYEEQSARAARSPIPPVYVANRAYATREEAEIGAREITERATSLGNPTPKFRIVEASTVQEALAADGHPIPPRIC